MPVFAPVMTATFPRAAVARVATPTREVVVDDVDACARECIANARRRRRRRVKPCHSNQINQSARPFTVSEKTRLGNGDADDADDDDDSKRHFCVYVFVCGYSANKSIQRRAPSPFPRKLVSETVTTTTPMMMIQNVIFVCTCLYVYTVRI